MKAYAIQFKVVTRIRSFRMNRIRNLSSQCLLGITRHRLRHRLWCIYELHCDKYSMNLITALIKKHISGCMVGIKGAHQWELSSVFMSNISSPRLAATTGWFDRNHNTFSPDKVGLHKTFFVLPYKISMNAAVHDNWFLTTTLESPTYAFVFITSGQRPKGLLQRRVKM